MGRGSINGKSKYMNNADMAAAVADKHGLSKVAARAIVDDIFVFIVGAALQGDDVVLSGFGKFTVKTSAERQGRNPGTGAAITIAASRKLAFSSAKAVKDRLNG